MSVAARGAVLALVLLPACSTVLGLPDEYTGAAGDGPSSDAGTDAVTEDQSVEQDAPEEETADGPGADGDATTESGSDAEAGPPPTIMGLGGANEHACAIARSSAGEHELWCWGACGNDRLGSACTALVTQTAVRVMADSFAHPLTDVVAIAGSLYSTCAVLDAGGVVCWGDCLHGAVGNPTECFAPDGGTSRSVYPVPVVLGDAGTLSGIRGLDSYGERFCARDDTTNLYCWGANAWNAGLVPTAWDEAATLQPFSFPSPLLEVAVGTFHVCVRTADDVWCWGQNHWGQVNGGDATEWVAAPEDIGVGGPPVALAVGDGHSCAVVGPGGNVTCWGKWGGNAEQYEVAAVMNGLVALDDIHALSAGYHHTCGLDSLGQVWCWGGRPKLWSGIDPPVPAEDYGPPRKVESAAGVPLTGMTHLAAGGSFTCAASGTEVFCWGDLSYVAGKESCGSADAGPDADCAVYARRIEGFPPP